MSDGPNETDVLAAAQASGYLMEQAVATELENLGYHVATNHSYEDLDEQKSREMDVWAFRRKHHDTTFQLSVVAELICECKKNDGPFVFIGRRKGELDSLLDPEQYSFPHQHYEFCVPPISKEVRPFAYFGLRGRLNTGLRAAESGEYDRPHERTDAIPE
jgi:hypothetical protein